MWILQELCECIIDLVGDDAREPFGFAPEVFALSRVSGTQPFSASSADRVHASRRLSPRGHATRHRLGPEAQCPRQGRVIVSLDPKSILDSLSPYGEIGLIVMIFAETGLLIGFFLPGDSLMFTAGLLGEPRVTQPHGGPHWLLPRGPHRRPGRFYDRRDPRTPRRTQPRRQNLETGVHRATHNFFDRHGPKTIVLARFVPIVRTFAPVVAGVARMRRSVFLRYNVVGAGLWVLIATLAGYLLADLIGTSIDTYILPIVGIVIIVSLIPPYLEWRRHRHETGESGAESNDS